MKKTRGALWEKEKLRHLISAVYSANEEPHSSSSVINGTTDFIDDLHKQVLVAERKRWVVEASDAIAKQMLEYAGTPLSKRKNAYDELYKARLAIEALEEEK